MVRVGTELKSRYRVMAEIGRGGMGVVYRALDLISNRQVAVKCLSSLADSGSQRFQRETQALFSLDHPNIVSILDSGEEEGLPYIVMELLSGRSLRALLPLPIPQAIAVVTQICTALEYAHRRGLVHRDIKPENVIIIDPPEAFSLTAASVLQVKVMDFGLARRIEERSNLTESGALVGTVAYLSPEQALGLRADERSDLYSLGAMFYELLTGREVFPGKTLIGVIFQHLDEPPVPPRRYNPEMAPNLERIVLRLLKKEPDERFQSATELLAALETLSSPPLASSLVEEQIVFHPHGANIFGSSFVAREKDLAYLRARLNEATHGQGSFVLVGGEPGVGKTRLVHELLAYARLRRAQVLSGACYEQESGLPYQPFVDALRAYAETIGMQRPAVLKKACEGQERELRMLVPEIAGLTKDPEPPGFNYGGEPEKSRLFEAVRRFLCRLGEGNCAVLFLDDLQWADAGTLQLLHYIVRQIGGERVLVVGTFRDTEPGAALESLTTQLSREKLYQKIVLERLTLDEARRLASTLLEAGELADDLLRRIYDETEGNPFFMVETVQHLLEERSIELVSGEWRSPTKTEPTIPTGVRDVIARRLSRLSNESQQVLGVAAVVGREFGFDTLLRMTERDENALLEAIEEALEARLIREKPLRKEDRYDFAHGKIREVLYEGLSARRRKILHRSIGAALEDLGDRKGEQVVGELAYHFGRAGEPDKAIAYGLRAGQLALSVYATEDAAKHFGEAVSWIEEMGGHPQAAEAQAKLGASFLILGRFAEALEAYQKAVALIGSEATAHAVDLAQLNDAVGMVHERLGRYDEALRHLFAGLQNLGEDRKESLEAARIYGHLGTVYSRRAQYEEAVDYVLRNLRLAEKLGNDEEVANACTILAHLSSLKAEWDDAASYTARALAVWRRKNDVYRQALNNLNLGVNLWPQGRWKEAAACWEKALQTCSEIHYAIGQMQGHINLGNFHHRTGDTLKAGDHYRAALRLAENAGHSYYTGRSLMRLGELHRTDGDLIGSVSLLTRAKESMEGIGHSVALSEVLWNLAETLMGMDDIAKAKETAEKALSLVEQRQSMEEIANSKRVLAAICAKEGQIEQAHSLYRESIEYFNKLGDSYELTRARYDFGRFLLTQTDGQAEGRELLASALRSFTILGALHERRQAELLLGLSF